MNVHRSHLRRAVEPGAFQRIVLTAFELSTQCRNVFLLCDMQSYTIAETGAILGISEPEVSARLVQARRELNKRMHDGRPASC